MWPSHGSRSPEHVKPEAIAVAVSAAGTVAQPEPRASEAQRQPVIVIKL